MLKNISLAVVFVIGCGDDSVPKTVLAETWGDAEEIWADTWCTYAETCSPEFFDLIYGDHENCFVEVFALNCEQGAHDCDAQFPTDRLDDLELCRDEMNEIVCTATSAPDSCFVTFAPEE